MKNWNHLIPITLLLFISLSYSTISAATKIFYEVNNLTGTQWEYTYTMSGVTFDMDFGFTIYFAPDLYENLVASSVHPDWDILIIQPDKGLPGDGFYDALARIDGASLADPFRVTFDWLGIPGMVPESQPFEIYDNGPPWNIIGGADTEAVPVPTTIILLGAGLVCLVGAKRRAKAHP